VTVRSARGPVLLSGCFARGGRIDWAPMGQVRRRVGRTTFALALVAFTPTATASDASAEEQMANGSHFVVNSTAKSPSPAEIAEHLERTWQTFSDLFGVEPAGVRVVLSVTSGGAQGTARADQGSAPTGRTMAWIVAEGEDLNSQGFSDLSHEIAHIYFLDLMGSPQGHHQPHAWLHEAVACYHESPSFVANREKWIRERLSQRIPLAELFEMKNPVKENPLVELTVELHGKLARGETSVAEMNEQISGWASSHAQELMQAGIRNMTYYAESLSVFQFLLAREGKPFVRAMAKRLREGARMEEILHDLPHHPRGIASLQEEWVRWVEAQAP